MSDVTDLNALIERLEGPHEWGYRCLAGGGFVADDTPFDAATKLRTLAEQRGADRAFEEAERYRTLAEAALECEYPHLRELARLALRQRIGEK